MIIEAWAEDHVLKILPFAAVHIGCRLCTEIKRAEDKFEMVTTCLSPENHK